mgnify:CR=1 FL=1
MNRTTGAAISGLEHLRQSVGDILSTPIGSRVMLRDYGCDAPGMVDRPINELFDIELHAAIAGLSE